MYNHDEFDSLNNVLNGYNRMKEEIRNLEMDKRCGIF